MVIVYCCLFLSKQHTAGFILRKITISKRPIRRSARTDGVVFQRPHRLHWNIVIRFYIRRAPPGPQGVGGQDMPISQFLNGDRFDPETRRVLGIAFEMTCIALQTEGCDDFVKQAIAAKIIELDMRGQRDRWQSQAERLAALATPPATPPEWQSWWRWPTR